MRSTLLALALLTTGAATLHAQQPGDIAIVGFNADNPDAFAFVALAPVSAGTTIHFTDNGWRAAGGFRANEGTFSYTVPGGGLAAGTVVAINAPAGPNFSTSGDQLLAYTGSEDNPSFVYALNVEGSGWQADATSSNTSALPAGLTNGVTAVAVGEIDNVAYVGTTTGSRTELLAAIGNPANWSGSNSAAQSFPTSFSVDGNTGGGNQAPSFSVALTNRSLVAGTPLTFTYEAIDPENDPLTYTLTNGPGTLSAASGLYTWTPATTDAGQAFTVTVTVSDGELTAQTTATLTIVDEAPTGTLFPGLSGDALRDAVASAYSPDQTLGYNRGRDTLYAVVEPDANGVVYGIYTGFSVQLDPSADPSSHLFTNGINAEHTWPQSLGASSEPQRSDMHILYPSKSNVNSARGNNPYGELTTAEAVRWYRGAQSQTSPPSDPSSWSTSGDNAFEPRDAVKGDVARAIFYYATIYGGLSSSFFQGQAETLLAWNAADPPSSQEVERSSRIAVYQGNVNPFALDPTLMPRIRGLVANQPPAFTAVLASQTLSTAVPFAFQYAASDPNGDALSYTLTSGPGTINATSGQYSWTPASSDAGQSFVVTVAVSDGQTSATTSATLTVEAPNTAPVFTTAATDQSILAQQPFAFAYTATDADGDAITYSLTAGPGTLDAISGQYSWTPPASNAGQSFVVTVSASDGQASATTSATLTVDAAANTAPAFAAVLADQTVTAGQAFAFTYTAEDADGDALTYTLTEGPGTLDGTSGQYSWTPAANDTGQALTVSVSVSDGQASATTSATLTVQAAANTAPAFVTVLADQALTVGQPFAFQYEAADADGDALTYTLTEGPGTLDATGRFTWTPGLSAGDASFTIAVSASDGQASATTRATLSVTRGAVAYGDVSGNGQVGADDAALILLAVTTNTTPDIATALRADVSGNGQVTAYDAALVLQYLVGLIDCFPAAEGCAIAAPSR
ncbi:MAG: putative Ig domain-containing protein [Bacteroidota bacterium]